jgi:hypothetical protein
MGVTDFVFLHSYWKFLDATVFKANNCEKFEVKISEKANYLHEAKKNNSENGRTLLPTQKIVRVPRPGINQQTVNIFMFKNY